MATKPEHLKAAIQAAFREQRRWKIVPALQENDLITVMEFERSDDRPHARQAFGTDREAREFIWSKVLEAATAGLIRSGGQLDKS